MNVTPNMLTLLGVLFMTLYVLCIPFSLLAALFFLFISGLADSIDGVVARFTGVSSDRGKFIDVMADNFNSFLFAAGLSLANIVEPFILIAYVYFMLLGKVFKVYLNSFWYQSDWFFRPVAGLITNLINYLAYFLFLIYVFYKFNMNTPFLIMTLVLMSFSIWHFLRIIDMRKK